MGATTCYPNAKAVVLVTRRPPELLRAGEEDVITVAVAEWQQHQKGRGIYYLVSESVDENRDAAPLAVPAANVPEFEPGTYLALISYATGGFWTGRNDRDSLGFVINTRLWRPPLPVTLMNRIAKGDHPKTHQGRRLQFDTTPRGDRKTFTDVVPFRMNGATHHLPIEVYYFEGGPSGDVGSMRNFIAKGHSVLLLANGQAHKHWDQQVPDDVEAGATATINAAIRDWQKSSGGVGNDLVWETELEVVEMTKSDSESKPKKNKKKTASKGAQVAVLWRDNDYAEDWNGGTPGSIEAIEASILADERDEYKELAELGSAQVPTVVLNQDFSPLKKYEAERIKRHKEGTLDQARDRYAVGVGVGLLVLEERNRKLDKEGKERPIDTLAERVAVARAALALMPDFDKLVMEAGLESE